MNQTTAKRQAGYPVKRHIVEGLSVYRSELLPQPYSTRQVFDTANVTTKSGVVIDISPATPLIAMQKAVREAIRDVCGEGACTWSQSKPHVSTHYYREATDSEPWSQMLRQIDQNHAPLYITSITLVDVRPDNITKRLE